MVVRLEDFEVLETIGRGTHGIVRMVRRKCDDKIFVWKELHYASMNDVEKQSLVQEVNLLRELRHPNIVKFYHHIVDRSSGTLFIVMEYCHRGDLNQLVAKCLKTGSFLEEGFIWKVLKQICEALRHCHEKHVNGGAVVLHRDIKPANVFLDEEGNVKLGDFGLAKTLGSEAAKFANTFVGTPYYMSPEVIEGGQYNERSDIWSLGCLIYELCTLHPPFRATNQDDLTLKIKAGRYDRIPVHYSRELWDIIGVMLTQEDFLRPTALMILYHSALVENTSVEDSLERSLSLSITPVANHPNSVHYDVSDAEDGENCSNDKRMEEDVDHCNEDETTEGGITHVINTSTDYSDNFLCETVRECNEDETTEGGITHVINTSTDYSENFLCETVRESLPKSREGKEIEGAVEKKVELTVEHRLRKESLDQFVCEEIYTEENSTPAIAEENGEVVFTSSVTESFLCSLADMSMRKLDTPEHCICGGMSQGEWRAKVSSLRDLEVAVRKREIAVIERERDLARREKRIQALENEAKQHLVRAQIYLKHSRIKDHPKPLLLPPHQRVQNDEDMDATTVSADIGYDEIPTAAFVVVQRKDNPFLRMREKSLTLTAGGDTRLTAGGDTRRNIYRDDIGARRCRKHNENIFSSVRGTASTFPRRENVGSQDTVTSNTVFFSKGVQRYRRSNSRTRLKTDLHQQYFSSKNLCNNEISVEKGVSARRPAKTVATVPACTTECKQANTRVRKRPFEPSSGNILSTFCNNFIRNTHRRKAKARPVGKENKLSPEKEQNFLPKGKQNNSVPTEKQTMLSSKVSSRSTFWSLAYASRASKLSNKPTDKTFRLYNAV